MYFVRMMGADADSKPSSQTFITLPLLRWPWSQARRLLPQGPSRKISQRFSVGSKFTSSDARTFSQNLQDCEDVSDKHHLLNDTREQLRPGVVGACVLCRLGGLSALCLPGALRASVMNGVSLHLFEVCVQDGHFIGCGGSYGVIRWIECCDHGGYLVRYVLRSAFCIGVD